MEYSDVHEAFAASRSSNYVFVPGDETSYLKLDQHAETIEGDVKDPLVVLGPPGCGKSALLANWVQRRRLTKHKEEFLFHHYVGCSSGTKQLSQLLFRLESALKDFFQLREMEVPKSEERLRWSLSRFLYSAAKKQYPARIVIVLDGVDKLRGETGTADSMHWLPTQLEPGVRFILSTSEYERYALGGVEPSEGSKLHRTWTELRRRKCPFIRVEPLTMDVRHSIIEAFVEKYNAQEREQSLVGKSADASGIERMNGSALIRQDSNPWLQDQEHNESTSPRFLDLNSANRFKIATAKPSSQPMFLRTILYALRLGVEMSPLSIDEQIDNCLSAESSELLVSQVFDLCSTYVDGSGSDSILGRVLSVVYASRHGLSEEEIWGSVEMGLGRSLPENVKGLILRILDDLTMNVTGLRLFSHEDYHQAVYRKYIQTPELNIRLHHLMARYFGRLEPCDRKLESLPYHLEVSGSWNKLRNALVGVDMFRLWWTPKHKSEFIALWSSLTDRNNPKNPIKRLVTGEFDDTMRCNQSSRPCYDVVDEYVKSCDEFKYHANPSYEELADVLHSIADFMLEFAMLGLEETADVPQFIHPALPVDDLRALGVPFLDTHEDMSVLVIPVIDGEPGKVRQVVDAPQKMNEEIPVRSTYFFHRWMWIQFPWIAMANCGRRFQKGLDYAASLKRTYKKDSGGASLDGNKLATMRGATKTKTAGATGGGVSDNPSIAKLPSIGVNTRKYISKTHTLPQAKPGDVEVNEEFIEKQYADTEAKVRFEIEDRRGHLDYLRQQRSGLERARQRLLDESRDLEKMHFGSTELERIRDGIGSKIEKTEFMIRSEKDLHGNFLCVHRMCQRHPAQSAALIDEIEIKLKVDATFIDQVRAKLREQMFDAHMYMANEQDMQRAIKESSLHQHELLTYRQKQARNFRKYMENTVALPSSDEIARDLRARDERMRSKSRAAFGHKPIAEDEAAERKRVEYWEEWQAVIHQRTGISDPATFFQRFESSAGLEKQMSSMRKSAEKRQKELRDMVNKVEKDLEEARYEAQAAEMQSGEVRDGQNKLTRALREHQHLKERAESAERLVSSALSGLQHVCETLGMPPVDKDTQISDIINSIDELLDALLEEKDRAQQKSSQAKGQSRQHKSETSLRASELNAAMNQFQTPKQRVAQRLHGRIQDGKAGETAEEEEKGLDEKMQTRQLIKSASMKTIKAEQRRQAREKTLEAQALREAML